MNAEDRALAVLSRANPMPDNLPIEYSTDAHAYLATLQTRSSEVTQLETKTKTDQPRPSSTWIAIAAVVAVVLGVAVVILTAGGGEESTTATNPPVTTTTVPTTEPEATLDPQLEEALAVATSFMEARANRDLAGIEATAIDGHIQGFIAGSFALLPKELAWLDAVGWTMEIVGCEFNNPDLSNTRVLCAVTHQNSISEALGEGPFEGSFTMRVQYAGEEKLGIPIDKTTITESLDLTFPVTEFTNGTWRPFANWLELNHPDDASTMYGIEVGADFPLFVASGERNPLLVDESIELWRQHVAEFVAEQSG